MRAIPDRAGTALVLAGLAGLALAPGCGGGGSSTPPADPAPEVDVLARGAPAPGIVVAITSIDGGSGPLGRFVPGDRPRVRFTLAKRDGRPWGLAEMDEGRILVSGPTFAYQRVIAEQTDVARRAEKLGDGSWLYVFETPIPATYLAPYNDSDAFGAGDGELAGTPLQDGTYTVGITLGWRYDHAGVPALDAGETAAHFRIGGGTTLVPRAVVGQSNCDACHVQLRAHEGLHRDVRVCVLCHTLGAEDWTDPGAVDPTPGVSIASKVMFHKLHSGQHLPSVLGIATNADGSRNYAVEGAPYVLVDRATGAHDYSNVGFPAWPNRSIPMPRNSGYGALSDEAKAKDELFRRGITSCDVCHGDPDGAGPIAAPAQGATAFAQPSRMACGACHDDVDWSVPYDKGNFSVMPPQTDDAICRECHFVDDDFVPSISSKSAHYHPLVNPNHNPFIGEELRLELSAFGEGAASDHDGTLDPGETLTATLRIRDGQGADVVASTLGGITAVLSGPTTNANLVRELAVPKALLAGASPWTIELPERVQLERIGASSATTDESFVTARAPHFDVAGAVTQVFARVASGPATALANDVHAEQNFVDVDDGSTFARDDAIVIDDGIGGLEEYLRLQFVEGNRLWFSSPRSPDYAAGLRSGHAAGAEVRLVGLAELARGAQWTLDAASGTVQEVGEAGDGVVLLASYTAALRFPARYPEAANGSLDFGAASGEWSGSALVDGTYRLTVAAWRDFDYFGPGATTRYRAASPAASVELLVGSASVLAPYSKVSSGANCTACHQELYFHEEQYRGFDACIACHGNAGAEDVPRYVAANAPATSGAGASFTSLLHALHGSSFRSTPLDVVTRASGPWPDNFGVRTWSDVLFPALPARSGACAKCHGAENDAWDSIAAPAHPDAPGVKAQIGRAACLACHDGVNALAHVELYTLPGGNEDCNRCHAQGGELPIEAAHDVR
ncbi:MAG: hypothetical protein HZA53_14205 [Planctomycetes bacterium]|nr:hypothetical protein [Planctomycetota bacterium]